MFISWAVFITTLSLFSFGEESVPSIDVPHLDKLVHFSFYYVFTALGCLSFREVDRRNTSLKNVMVKLILLAVVYGIIIEILQGVATTDRHPDLLDVLANSLGALFGSYTVKYIFSEKTPFKWMK
ncbi:MAG: VanZ family protein [Flavobacteriaceae bacterium]